MEIHFKLPCHLRHVYVYLEFQHLIQSKCSVSKLVN